MEEENHPGQFLRDGSHREHVYHRSAHTTCFPLGLTRSLFCWLSPRKSSWLAFRGQAVWKMQFETDLRSAGRTLTLEKAKGKRGGLKWQQPRVPTPLMGSVSRVAGRTCAADVVLSTTPPLPAPNPALGKHSAEFRGVKYLRMMWPRSISFQSLSACKYIYRIDWLIGKTDRAVYALRSYSVLDIVLYNILTTILHDLLVCHWRDKCHNLCNYIINPLLHDIYFQTFVIPIIAAINFLL